MDVVYQEAEKVQTKWTVKWTEKWLNCQVQRVNISNTPCNSGSVISGGHQWPILGLIVFNIFINDLDNCTKCTLSKFADTTKLEGVVDTLHGCSAIQQTSTECRNEQRATL